MRVAGVSGVGMWWVLSVVAWYGLRTCVHEVRWRMGGCVRVMRGVGRGVRFVCAYAERRVVQVRRFSIPHGLEKVHDLCEGFFLLCCGVVRSGLCGHVGLVVWFLVCVCWEWEGWGLLFQTSVATKFVVWVVVGPGSGSGRDRALSAVLAGCFKGGHRGFIDV